MGLFMIVYFLAVALMALTVAWAGSLAHKSGQRMYRAFFYLIIINDLACLSDILFQVLPAQAGTAAGRFGAMMSGFLEFPVMAAFSILAVDFMLALAELPFPKLLKKIFIAYWGLLFLGFLAAEFRHFVYQDMRLTHALKPFFHVAIIASGVGASLFVFLRGRALPDRTERRFVRRVSGYFLAAFVLFGGWFFIPFRLGSEWNVPARSLLGLAYLLPALAWLQARFRRTKDTLLTRLAGAGDILNRWLETQNLSPRERQIACCVLEGKSNSAIEKELFIGRRTVESHLYSIYRKMGVKNRLQLARLAAAEAERRDHS
jgi:DNA-binding CsgD family transcriptional regulator